MSDRHDRMRGTEGFTLLELIAVLGIIGMLLLIAVASYIPAARRAEAVACEHDVMVLNRAISQYQATNPGIVPLLDDLHLYVQDYDSSIRCPSDDTTYTIDPVTATATCVNHP